MEKQVIAAQLHPIVRGLSTSATSSPLDDHRPADRPTAYHTTAATAKILCGPCSKSQPEQIRASHRRDESLVMRAHNPFQTESLSLVIGFVWTSQVVIAEMPCYPILDQVNQFRIHELVFIRNVKDVQWRCADSVAKLSEYSCTMLCLHHENDISPNQIGVTELSRRPNTQPARTDGEPIIVAKHTFRCGASPPVS